MRVLLTSEAKFERTPDGTVWGAAAYGSAVWRRYLEVFSGVVMAARVADVSQPSSGCVEASGPGIDILCAAALLGACRILQALPVRAGRDRAGRRRLPGGHRPIAVADCLPDGAAGLVQRTSLRGSHRRGSRPGVLEGGVQPSASRTAPADRHLCSSAALAARHRGPLRDERDASTQVPDEGQGVLRLGRRPRRCGVRAPGRRAKARCRSRS